MAKSPSRAYDMRIGREILLIGEQDGGKTESTGTRTQDTRLKRAVLYRLSYTLIGDGLYCTPAFPPCQCESTHLLTNPLSLQPCYLNTTHQLLPKNNKRNEDRDTLYYC